MNKQELTLPVRGMTCASCVSHVEKALSGVQGVSEVNVNLATEKATVTFIPSTVDTDLLKTAVADAGYRLKEPQAHTSATENG